MDSSATGGAAGVAGASRAGLERRRKPVPAGMSLPMITFSFSPCRPSVLPSMAAWASTLIVCWKEEAERKESVLKEALVMPSKTSTNLAGRLPSASSWSLTRFRSR